MNKFESKKFTITFLILALTTGLALLKMLTPEVAGVFTGVGMLYNGGQSYVDGRINDEPKN